METASLKPLTGREEFSPTITPPRSRVFPAKLTHCKLCVKGIAWSNPVKLTGNEAYVKTSVHFWTSQPALQRKEGSWGFVSHTETPSEWWSPVTCKPPPPPPLPANVPAANTRAQTASHQSLHLAFRTLPFWLYQKQASTQDAVISTPTLGWCETQHSPSWQMKGGVDRERHLQGNLLLHSTHHFAARGKGQVDFQKRIKQHPGVTTSPSQLVGLIFPHLLSGASDPQPRLTG